MLICLNMIYISVCVGTAWQVWRVWSFVTTYSKRCRRLCHLLQSFVFSTSEVTFLKISWVASLHSIGAIMSSGTPCRTTSAHSRIISPLDRAWKPGFSLDTSVLIASETLWQCAIYIHIYHTIPYHTIPLVYHHVCRNDPETSVPVYGQMLCRTPECMILRYAIKKLPALLLCNLVRSSSTNSLLVPRTCTCYGDRNIAVASPAAWNDLPAELIDSSLSLSAFRKLLKTVLFISIVDTDFLVH